MEPVLVVMFISMIPIAALLSSAYRKVRFREYAHKERMLAIERGAAVIPDGLAENDEERRRGKRGSGAAIHGVVWSGIGAGLLAATLLMSGHAPDSDIAKVSLILQIWALPSLFVGVGLLIYAYLTRNGREARPAKS